MKKATKEPRQWKADELLDLLHKRYCAPQYALLEQVRNGTGYTSVTRTADALAMSLWPSRGLTLEGFEVKVYRGDWLNELKRPEKAEEIAQFCNNWWIVAPKDIVRVEELPPTWGLLVPHGGGLKALKAAPDLPKPLDLDRLFIAAILRNVTEHMVHHRSIEKKLQAKYELGKGIGLANADQARHEYERMKEMLDGFKEASGLDIANERYSHNITDIGKAVKMVLDGRHKKTQEDLRRIRYRLNGLIERVDEELKAEGVSFDPKKTSEY